jgi:hypothetical protein
MTEMNRRSETGKRKTRAEAVIGGQNEEERMNAKRIKKLLCNM